MSKLTDVPKRILIGRALRSDRLGETLLPKRIALPVFASDPLSSVAYAPGEVLLVLSIAGLSAYHFSPWIAAAVVVLMFTVVASYRQNVHAYPSGGGDYEVATTNLGPRAGLTVASALLVDYVLTVAVSISSGIENLGSAVPFVVENKVACAVGVIVLLTLMNLRGVRESGTLFAIPTYVFVAGVFLMIAWGAFRGVVLGDDMRAPTADFEIKPEHPGLAGFALVFLLLRAFSSGCAALTGVEAISNGVPGFRKPKSRNAATTLAMMGLLAVTMFCGIIALAAATDVRMAENPGEDLVHNGVPLGPGYVQDPVISQVAEAVFGHGSVLFMILAAATALVLFLAANTAYNGFPLLGSILAQDRYLPRQLHTRGDRLAFSNGIVLLAGAATLLVCIYGADSTRLIQLYIVGVFVSFTLSQIGMVRHWNRLLAGERDLAARRHMIRSRAINAFGAFFTGLVLVVVLLTKFTHGAWVALLGMCIFYATMTAIRRHYDRVAEEIAAPDTPSEDTLRPSRVHSVVLVSKVHRPALRALAYAKLLRSDTLEAVSVNVDPEETRALREEWERRGIDVPLKVLDSPYREVTRPVIEYVKSLRAQSPRDVVSVIIPEYVVGHWYEHFLHNQSALRLKGRLLFTPGVMVTSVPYQLESSEAAKLRARRRQDWAAPGSVRRGPAERAKDSSSRT
ncbi:APC family permease [Streptomyces cellulosae]|uniref:APC family permease n=2 Tax=Streptomyces TaxID=1883 RepID=A0ABU3J2W7_9ACTN|nr:APC family permease [Streptomyces sp. McG7]MBT2904243.1 APC family permease [Streptomyces sp. McG8]MCX4479814.1 APC family permease [Streptomyces cellulosae]MDQ0486134.1 amino acid transporter [Streptomyces thermodiastaticus]MDT6968363.1 APC family permease [Streptomyces thermocarboxydus]MXQ56577.1 amino acid permease [Streptomyces sp. XHT-2]MYQ33637.1 amino acid permease [Streptomyces sp. SID4956]MYW55734.1 amino acid permease [Streptomyces sp. SID8376]THC54351.1 APC family permease [St